MLGKTEKTHVIKLLDESGSMGPYRNAVIGSVNDYVKGLRRKTRRCFMSLYKFDSRQSESGGVCRAIFENRKVSKVHEVTHVQYAPHGGTPLFDAIGELITATKKRLPKSAKVIFVIHTDGQENASMKWNQETVKELIRKCEKKRGWTFVYLGEGKEAWNAGYDFGVQNVANFTAGARGMSMDKLTTATAYFSNTDKSLVGASHSLYDSAGIDNPDDIEEGKTR